MPKVILSPSQALLILIKHYQDNTPLCEEYKRLYLLGANTYENLTKIQEAFKDEILAEYEISYDFSIINQDPSRRYFESHLAFQTIKHQIKTLPLKKLKDFFADLQTSANRILTPQTKRFLSDIMGQDAEDKRPEIRPDDSDSAKDYKQYLINLGSPDFLKELGAEDKLKMSLLVKSALLGIMLAANKTEALPLDIYAKDLYSESARGKIEKKHDLKYVLKDGVEKKIERLSHNLGLMKSYMPMPQTDLLFHPIALMSKPSDQAHFDPQAEWVKLAFSQLFHPFSNSISGTLLGQLRTHAYLRDQGQTHFTSSGDALKRFIQLFISTRLINSGGHSLLEFTAPIGLAETQAEFATTPDFDKISLESMFLTDNAEAFEEAIRDTLIYNQSIISKKQIHAQIHENQALNPLIAKHQCIDKLTDELLDLNAACKQEFIGICQQKFSAKQSELDLAADLKSYETQAKAICDNIDTPAELEIIILNQHDFLKHFTSAFEYLDFDQANKLLENYIQELEAFKDLELIQPFLDTLKRCLSKTQDMKEHVFPQALVDIVQNPRFNFLSSIGAFDLEKAKTSLQSYREELNVCNTSDCPFKDLISPLVKFLDTCEAKIQETQSEIDNLELLAPRPSKT